jgi:ATP synthase protein I
MLRAAFGAGSPKTQPSPLVKENAMADPNERNGGDGDPGGSDDATLQARLRSLDARLGHAAASRPEAKEPAPRSTSNSNAIGQAMRLSAEFVSGVIAGGIVGWLVDRLFGSTPWGLIVCLILGFCAGMLNLMRASGVVKTARYDETER